MDDKDNAWDDELWNKKPGMRESYADIAKSFGILLLIFFMFIGIVTLLILWFRWLF